tara:strand:- start:506 stop:748 length:243 start_codon:yes stop_codon:yes gene_type:complete
MTPYEEYQDVRDRTCHHCLKTFTWGWEDHKWHEVGCTSRAGHEEILKRFRALGYSFWRRREQQTLDAARSAHVIKLEDLQ